MIDFFTLIFVVLSIYNGLRKGLVMAIISLVANFIGLLIAVKCSAAYAQNAISSGEPTHWSPMLIFVVVMLLSIFLVRKLGKIVEKILTFSFLGWANRLGGIVIYFLLYFMIYSILLFYLHKMGIISDDMAVRSKTFNLVSSMGPTAVDWMGKIIPVFKDLFQTISKSIVF